MENITKAPDDLYEKREHGNLDYPVSVYFVDLSKLYLNQVRWHWHEEMEVIIINNGVAEVASDEGSVILSSGQAVIINQNVMHSVYIHGSNNCTLYALDFLPDYFLGYHKNSLHSKYLAPYQANNYKLMVLDESIPWQAQMIDNLNDVVATNLTRQYCFEIVTKGYLCQFWATLVDHLNQEQTLTESTPVSVDEQRVKHAMNYIRQNHASAISLDEIAESIHISKSECCRCFKRTLQMTPFEYLMKYRIFEAAKKISDKNNPVTSMADLAISVGFNNISYFNKLFRKYMGCTPTQYRKNVAKSTANSIPTNGIATFPFAH